MLMPLLLHPSAAEPTVFKRAALEVCSRLLALLLILSLVMWIALPAAEKDRLLNTFNLQRYWAKIRIWLWKAGPHTAEERLLVGTGPGTYQIYSRSLPWNLMTRPEWKQFPGTFHAHNGFIETASDQGIVGLASALAVSCPREHFPAAQRRRTWLSAVSASPEAECLTRTL
jgi:O-antigen ligase